ncbi:MAG TPA: prepilin-type N-terminal cleavage/methylation domain-containing protein [Planctomycetota bacterium]
MNHRNACRGFTLIELMIVIAIIAVIAAIAIPGLMSSQRAANERNASASLKTVTAAEIDFRSNDRDGNKIQDFWTRDLSGLYTLCPIGADQPLRLIDLSLAGADSNPLGTAPAPIASDQVTNLFFTVQSPKAGYWCLGFELDDEGTPYATATYGLAPFTDQLWFHRTKFAFMAYPDNFSSGRSVFVVNEANTVFRRGTNGTIRPPGGLIPPGTALVASYVIGTAPVLEWPTDTVLKLTFSKLD